MLEAGLSVEQLKGSGYSAKELRDAHRTVDELKGVRSLPTPTDLAQSDDCLATHASHTRLDARWQVGFELSDLRAAGFSAQELQRVGFGAEELRAAGTSLAELTGAGASVSDCRCPFICTKHTCIHCTQTLYRLPTVHMYPCHVHARVRLQIQVADLKAAGISAIGLKAEGISLAEMKAVGYTVKELKSAGFTPTELRDVGFKAAQLTSADYTAKELKEGGYTSAEELREAGCMVWELKEGGFSAKELKRGMAPMWHRRT